jgi:hypothetical protein
MVGDEDVGAVVIISDKKNTKLKKNLSRVGNCVHHPFLSGGAVHCLWCHTHSLKNISRLIKIKKSTKKHTRAPWLSSWLSHNLFWAASVKPFSSSFGWVVLVVLAVEWWCWWPSVVPWVVVVAVVIVYLYIKND